MVSDEATTAPNTRRRIQSIDAFRGLAIILMFLVSSRSPFVQLRHVPWDGFRISDLVYTAFLFTVGASMHLSFSAQRASGAPPQTLLRRAALRSLRLFTVGIVLLSASYSSVRFGLGTLQCIALAALLAAPFASLGPRGCLAGGIAILVLVTVAEAMFNKPGAPALFAEGYSLTERIDEAVLGKPKGEEGVLTTIGAVASVLFGVVGGALLAGRSLGGLLALGSALLVAGSLIAQLGIAVSPRAMTPSFVLIASGWSALVLSVFVVLEERLGLRRALLPFSIYGMNAIAAYLFVKLAQVYLFGTALGSATLKDRLWAATHDILGPAAADMSFPMTKVLLGWLLCAALYRRRLFLKI